MRPFFYCLLFLSFYVTAQTPVKVTVKDWLDDAQLTHLNIVAEHKEERGNYYFEANQLTEKVIFEQPNFRFDTSSLVAYPYTLHPDQLAVEVYAYPGTDEFYELKVPIAKSSKVKGNAVELTVYATEALPEIELYNSVGKLITTLQKTKMEFKTSKSCYKINELPFSKLEDGYFMLGTTRYPFSKKEWAQPICLQTRKSAETIAAETILLMAYFSRIATLREEQRKIMEINQKEIKKLRLMVETLKDSIDFLKNGPRKEDDNYGIYEVPPPQEAVEEDYWDWVYETAHPLPDKANFLEELKAIILKNGVLPHAGNITLKIRVSQAKPLLTLTVLHCPKSYEELLELIKQKIESTPWRFRWGLIERQDIILSIDMLPQ